MAEPYVCYLCAWNQSYRNMFGSDSCSMLIENTPARGFCFSKPCQKYKIHNGKLINSPPVAGVLNGYPIAQAYGVPCYVGFGCAICAYNMSVRGYIDPSYAGGLVVSMTMQDWDCVLNEGCEAAYSYGGLATFEQPWTCWTDCMGMCYRPEYAVIMRHYTTNVSIAGTTELHYRTSYSHKRFDIIACTTDGRQEWSLLRGYALTYELTCYMCYMCYGCISKCTWVLTNCVIDQTGFPMGTFGVETRARCTFFDCLIQCVPCVKMIRSGCAAAPWCYKVQLPYRIYDKALMRDLDALSLGQVMIPKVVYDRNVQQSMDEIRKGIVRQAYRGEVQLPHRILHGCHGNIQSDLEALRDGFPLPRGGVLTLTEYVQPPRIAKAWGE